jgi:hypothetical protein
MTMSEDIDLSGLLNEGEVPERDTFPVPGGYVDLVPIAATVYYDGGAAKVGPGGTWGFCPLGVFLTGAEDSGADHPVDGLIPFKQITSIIYHYDEYAEWLKEQDEGNSD